MASLKAPELYAGCLAGAPIADLEMNWSLASAHYKEFLTHFLGGSLEEVPDRYRNASPLTHIDNMAVPTFISAGTNDTSTYFPQTENFCNIAKEKGKEIYTYFDDSGHDTSDKNMIILQITNTLLFLKYVTNK
ncbi:MAG: prolyl oligopeptidase family serine peptidase [Candidatus Heimdallarchaeota archaeon]|nr:prolyl oligopeptidase family serine peptidase [Candidatus Heimdallarchaeota archaeon]